VGGTLARIRKRIDRHRRGHRRLRRRRPPDIFVVSKTESCRLFRNLGNFKFEDVTEKAGVGDHGADAMIWKQGATFVDVNNDGLLDIYVCRWNAPNLLYINQGNGTFRKWPMPTDWT